MKDYLKGSDGHDSDEEIQHLFIFNQKNASKSFSPALKALTEQKNAATVFKKMIKRSKREAETNIANVAEQLIKRKCVNMGVTKLNKSRCESGSIKVTDGVEISPIKVSNTAYRDSKAK